MRFEFFKPIRPWTITQEWGLFRPEVYSQFGFTRHNGTDVALRNGDIISAPFDYKVVKVGNQPTGGGIFVGLLSQNEYTFDDGVKARVLVDLLHCKQIVVQEGETGKVGDLVALGDNTGFSTGPHCHIQCRRVLTFTENPFSFVPTDTNDANNSFDPTDYYSRLYAEQYATIRDTIPTLLKMFEAIKAKVVNLK